MIKRKKSQTTLELAVTFIAFCAFILGIINIWVWGHAQIAGRNNSYEVSRTVAGSDSPGQPAGYNPSSLTEDEVILGN
ncbi:MAG: hypothetical protein K9L99_05890 [Candidatus Omnitrophica bacterium]|nr:hypothetical protein [Candidatus Omnitrophota bacterium]MCF7917241.1 hypothetical protein [Candidatus Omnitrophota bacterium]